MAFCFTNPSHSDNLCFAKSFTFVSGSKDSLTKETPCYTQIISVFNRGLLNFNIQSLTEKRSRNNREE